MPGSLAFGFSAFAQLGDQRLEPGCDHTDTITQPRYTRLDLTCHPLTLHLITRRCQSHV
jgi:hypothetical protein